MSVYVDPVASYDELGKWSHMVADSSAELHAMAAILGLKREWCQRPGTHLEHYDLRPSKRENAIKEGAVPVSSRDLVKITSKNRTVPS